jgi:NOL1/NOP2/sun family putative RNA methylase
VQHNIPPSLLSELRQQQGFDEIKFIEAQLQLPPTSIRLNNKKQVDFSASAKEHQNHAIAIPWCSNGFYLEKRPSFTYDPLFHAGCYYVQEASSMFLEFALKQTVDLNQALKILDLCAAPGGKSTLVASLINEESLLVSNEVIKNRATILKENISKWGNENVMVTNNDPKHFERLANYFDVLLIDAPCSGSGLFRKEPEYLNEWNENVVNLCSQRQQRILADVWKCLKPNGILIYSTCSFSESENEAIADWMIDELDAENILIEISAEFKIVETKSKKHQAQGFRFYPHLLQGEGFFCTIMRKKNSVLQFTKSSPIGEGKGEVKKKKELQNKNLAKKNIPINKTILSKWLKNIDTLEFQQKNEFVIAQPKILAYDFEFIASQLNVIKSGVNIGQLTHKDLIPEHELALSFLLNDDIQKVELSYEQAIQYLKKDNMDLTPILFKREGESLILNPSPSEKDFKSGWTLMQYQQQNLGWAKILPNRINNYYPMNGRILK